MIQLIADYDGRQDAAMSYNQGLKELAEANQKK